jgi:hypothetical protein
MNLDPAAGNGLLAALGSCGKQSAVPACPIAEMGMGILPPYEGAGSNPLPELGASGAMGGDAGGQPAPDDPASPDD